MTCAEGCRAKRRSRSAVVRAMLFSVSAPESFVPRWRRMTSGDSMVLNQVGSFSKIPLPP